jgi:hypothetical protein
LEAAKKALSKEKIAELNILWLRKSPLGNPLTNLFGLLRRLKLL